jgi:hypothetical protein
MQAVSRRVPSGTDRTAREYHRKHSEPAEAGGGAGQDSFIVVDPRRQPRHRGSARLTRMSSMEEKGNVQ